MMTSHSRRLGRLSYLLLGSGLALGAGSSALAHDEDYRKLIDRMEPFFGEIFRGGDSIGRAGANTMARRIKLADLADNMDLGRLSELRDRDIDRLRRYHAARRQLAAEGADS